MPDTGLQVQPATTFGMLKDRLAQHLAANQATVNALHSLVETLDGYSHRPPPEKDTPQREGVYGILPGGAHFCTEIEKCHMEIERLLQVLFHRFDIQQGISATKSRG